jgi:cytochrome c oxidase subunit 4
MNDDSQRFNRRARHLLYAWLALIALMLTSLGSAYLRLGPWNPVAGLVVAAIKSAIVLWLFMHLARASALLRIIAGLATLALLFALSGVDYATRRTEPAAMQQPHQLQSPKPGGSLR